MLRYAVLRYTMLMPCYATLRGLAYVQALSSPVMIGYSHTKQACFGNTPPLVEDRCTVTQ